MFHFTGSFLCWKSLGTNAGTRFLVGCIFFGKEILFLRFRESLPPITVCALPAIAKDVSMRDTNTVMENVVDDKTARTSPAYARLASLCSPDAGLISNGRS